MLGCEFRVAIYHTAGLPPAPLLELIAARPRLTMPRCPGVLQIMKMQVTYRENDLVLVREGPAYRRANHLLQRHGPPPGC